MLQSLKKGAELLLLLLSSLSGFELLLLELLVPPTISLVCKTVMDWTGWTHRERLQSVFI